MKGVAGSSERDTKIVRAVCRWFEAEARPLPWRAGKRGRGGAVRDPYLSLVSEFMLQQTQVSRVLEKWGAFVGKFPTVESLAAADDGQVMALWSGMGYYRRARNLHAAAREVVERFGGRVPSGVVDLQTLPGVGRYTAGAIASMVYGKAEPLVDGNVARVLVRVEGKELGDDEPVRWAWGRAERLVRVCEELRGAKPRALNEGLMELGAVICTPRAPKCERCPLRGECRAKKKGTQEDWPRPKRLLKRSKMYCAAVLVEDGKGRVLVEQRGDSGMWAGLWQAPTLERPDRRSTQAQLKRWLGVEGVTRRERFEHGTTHREVEFEVWTAASTGVAPGKRRWMTRGEIAGLGLSNPQRRILLTRR